MRPRKVILLVDDDLQILSIRGFVLDNWGYRVIRFSSGPAALIHLNGTTNGAIDLLLTDLVMPDMDGNELVRRAKMLHPGIPCMIVSGSVSSYERAGAADVFLGKGCTSVAEMLERCRILCSRKRGPKKHVVYTEEVQTA